MKKKQCLLLLSLFLAPAACDHSPVDPGHPVVPRDSIRSLTLSESQVAAASNEFAFQLLTRSNSAETAKPNFMISPLSASMALGMTLNGAAGSTFTAMRSALAFGDLTQAQVNAAYAGLMRQLYARAGTQVQFALANSVWYDKSDIAPLPTFVDTLKHYFDADVQTLDFMSPTAPATISKWAEDKTNGRIKDLIKSISPVEVMFLVNAVYFKAPWSKEFDPKNTRDASFTTMSGTSVTVPFMNRTGTITWVMNSDVHAVELPYADSAYSIVLWMPAPGKTMTSALSQFSGAKWDALLKSMHTSELMLQLPKFHIEYELELKDMLSALGMGIAFTDQADFSNIAARHDLYLTRVFQKTFIDVNEQGTEAAAATGVGVGVVSAPPGIAFKRPFFFAIRERASGAILFAGRVGGVSE